MKYTKEDLSPTKVLISVNVEAEEINAAIDAAVAMQQKGITLKGFRKGKVPASLIEKRFKGQLYHDAANDLTQVHLNTILGELNLVPVTPLTVTPTPIEIERNKDVQYTVEFEHMPHVDLPNYEGLEVEQKRVSTISDAEIDAFVARLRAQGQYLVPVEGEGPAAKGQYANLEFSYVLDGEETTASREMHYLVGQDGFPPLEELVSSLKVGESGEKKATFPDDFFIENLCGKSGILKVKIYSINEMKQPTDEELLAQTELPSMEALRKAASDSLVNQKNVLGRSAAQTALIEQLLGTVDFPLPESIVEGELAAFVERERNHAMRSGKLLTDDQEAEIRAKNLEQAKKQAKIFILLRLIAEKEGLQVTERELQHAVAQQAAQMNNVDPAALFKYYASSGHLYVVRDELLINKAADAIYAKAKVNMVEGGTAAESATDSKTGAGAESATAAEQTDEAAE